MKFAWNTQLRGLNDEPLANEQGPIVLRDLVVTALMTQDRKDLDGAAKFARYQLAAKVHNGADVDVTEAAIIKEVCGNVLAPLPVGRIWELLENPIAEKAVK